MIAAFVILAVATVAAVTAPWWWRGYAERRSIARRDANVAAYRSRLAELDTEVQSGLVGADVAEQARKEAGAHLLQDVEAVAEPAAAAHPSSPWIAATLGLSLILFGGAWYLAAGSWRTQDLVDLNRDDPKAARLESLRAMVVKLERQVAGKPDDAETWIWLGRSYNGLGRHADAARALERANQLQGSQDPDLLVEEGETWAMAQNRSMSGAPMERFTRALALSPDHPRALWNAGLAALHADDARGALKHWERLLAQPLDDEVRNQLQMSVNALRSRAGLPAATTVPAAAAADAVELRLKVTVAPEIANLVPPDAALLVFAQPADGPRMPLAVRRFRASDLPLDVVLNDSHSMIAARKLSSVDRWRLVARISKDGQAQAQSGDLEGDLVAARDDAGKPLKLVIHRRLP